MIFWNVFKNSVKLPNKNAMFQLNRIGLNITIFYIVILSFISSIPSIIDWLSNANGLGSEMNFVFALIYFLIIFYPLFTTAIFSLILIIAFSGKIISISIKRKLHYSLLWKMSAFTLTIPFLLYTIIAVFFDVKDIYFLLAFIYLMSVLFIMVTHYPKGRIKDNIVK